MSSNFTIFYLTLFGSFLYCTTASLEVSTDHGGRWSDFRQTTVVVCWPDSVQLQCPVNMHLLVVSGAGTSRRPGQKLPLINKPAASPSCQFSGDSQLTPGVTLSPSAQTCLENTGQKVEKRFRQLCEDRQTCQVAAHQLLVNTTRCPLTVSSPIAPIAYKCVPDRESGSRETICADTYLDVKCDSQRPSDTSMVIMSAYLGLRAQHSERHDFDDCPISSMPALQDEPIPLVCGTRVDVTSQFREMCNTRSTCSASPNVKITPSSGLPLEKCGKMHLSLTYVCVTSSLLVTTKEAGEDEPGHSLPTDDNNNANRLKKNQRQPKQVQNMKVERSRSEAMAPAIQYFNTDQHPLPVAGIRNHPDVAQHGQQGFSSSRMVSTASTKILFQPMTIGLVIGLFIMLVCITTGVLVCRSLYRRANRQRKFSQVSVPSHGDNSSLFGPTPKEPQWSSGDHTNKGKYIWARHPSGDHFNDSSSGGCNETLLPQVVGSDLYPYLGHASTTNVVENYFANKSLLCSTGISINAEGALSSPLMHQPLESRKISVEEAIGRSLLTTSNQLTSRFGSNSPVHSNQASACLNPIKNSERNSAPVHLSQPSDQYNNRTETFSNCSPTPLLYDSSLQNAGSMTGISASGRGCDGNSGHSESSDGPRVSGFSGERLSRDTGQLKMYRYPVDLLYDPINNDPCNSVIYSPGSNAGRVGIAQMVDKLRLSQAPLDSFQNRDTAGFPVGLESSGTEMNHKDGLYGRSKLQMMTSLSNRKHEIAAYPSSTLNSVTDLCLQKLPPKRPIDDTLTTQSTETRWKQLSPLLMTKDHQSSTESLTMPVIEPPTNFRSPPVSSECTDSPTPYQKQGYPPLLKTALAEEAQNFADADESECPLEEPPPQMPPLRGLRLGSRFAENTVVYFATPSP